MSTASPSVDTWFARLESLLVGTALDGGKGYRTDVKADEFMLMQVSFPGRPGFPRADFKHINSRNYLHLEWVDASPAWSRIVVPCGGPFYGAVFPPVPS